jgi:group II intron reverse transcriptase/maturase
MKMLKKQKLRNNEYYNIQSVFDKLYEQSKNGKNFTKLYDIIISEENILLAYRNIKKNKGSKTGGTNKRNIVDIGNKEPQKLINYVRSRLGDFKPHSIRRIEIDKEDGNKRPLGIPTIEDRLIQQCIKQVLEPICEAKFYKHSYGFRPNRGTHHAIARSLFLMNISKYHYVVDVDIKGFFDNVNHGKLLKQIYSLGIRDKRIISIISKMLKAEIKGIGIPTKGVPQGGILSPLLSNIVLNEFDHWIASQWEDIPISIPYSRTKYVTLRRASKLKPCFIVRYADDFRIYCKSLNHANKLLHATEDWLASRLKLSINKDKSRVVNLKTGYSEFLGFKFKLYRKSNKWVVKSHIRDKTIKRIKNTIKGAIKLIQYGGEDSSNILNFNRTILGVHNYYRVATNVNVDFNKIAFHINKTLKIRLRDKYKKKGTKNKLFLKYYSDYQGIVYYIDGIALFPVSKVTNKPPMCFTQETCNYTKEGRMKIHKSLKGVKETILYYLMDNPIKNQTVEYNDNRISLYVGQNGLCAITKESLQLGSMHAHHITPKFMGGTDKYQNLIFVTDDIHRLIHIKDKSLIEKYMMKLNISRYSLSKLNKLRDLIGNSEIQLT